MVITNVVECSNNNRGIYRQYPFGMKTLSVTRGEQFS